MGYWRRTDGFFRHAYAANVAMMSAGFVLIGMQLTGYFVGAPAPNRVPTTRNDTDVQHRHAHPRRAPDLRPAHPLHPHRRRRRRGLLVTVVLPAEYGIDPTGAGRLLGLNEMGEIKTQLHQEAEADRLRDQASQAAAPPPAAPEQRSSLSAAVFAELVYRPGRRRRPRRDGAPRAAGDLRHPEAGRGRGGEGGHEEGRQADLRLDGRGRHREP